MAGKLSEWLETAIPAIGHWRAQRISAEELLVNLDGVTPRAENTAFIIGDAADGDERTLRNRWTDWNSARERIREGFGPGEALFAAVLIVTRRRIDEICAAAPDLLSVSQVMTVGDEPFAVTADEDDLVRAYRNAIQELETHYRLTTDDFLAKLLARERIAIKAEDLERWKAAAEALRNVDRHGA